MSLPISTGYFATKTNVKFVMKSDRMNKKEKTGNWHIYGMKAILRIILDR